MMVRQGDDENYVIGDLLWAKIGSHPFWPCMVSYDPIDGTYFKTKKVSKGEARIYHVQYFGRKVQHGWTSPRLIFPYEGETKYYLKKVSLENQVTTIKAKKKITLKYSIPSSVMHEWHIAVEEADLALTVDIKERYENFVFKYEIDPKKTKSRKRKLTKKTGNQKNGSNKLARRCRITTEIDEELCKLCEKGSVELTCSGNCAQSYHKECLGLLCNPTDFKCFDCEYGTFSCFVCKKSDTSLIKCNRCIYYYHFDCIKEYECVNFEKNICPLHVCLTCHKENPRNISSKGPFVQCFRCPTTFHATKKCFPVGSVRLTPSIILCPDHCLGKNKISPQTTCNVTYCSICSEGGQLICCEACPNAYHMLCLNEDVPPGDFICEDCRKRDYLYIGMVVWAKIGRFRWWPAQIIDENELPKNIEALDSYDGEFPIKFFGTYEYFWTHRGRVIPYAEHHKEVINNTYSKSSKLSSQYKISLKEAAEAYDTYISEREKQKQNGKPDTYRHALVNRAVPPAYINVIAINSVSPCACVCDMSHPCGSDSLCLNRSMLMECHPDVCHAKDQCENQKFQKREYASVKVVRTINCGWGLVTKQHIPKGSFVIEYVGEIITHDEYRKRRIQMQENNIQNYYFLYLDSRRMIDAGPRGNLSRFINHSCSPNCKMEKWLVNGDLRIGIFAITDIYPDEELTFNYQSDSIQFDQKCHCRSPDCQGFIGRNGERQNGKNADKLNGKKIVKRRNSIKRRHSLKEDLTKN